MRAVRYIFLSSILFIYSSCNSESERDYSKDVKEDCIPFFTFDAVEHYYVEIDSKGFSYTEKKKDLSDIEKNQLNVMYEDTSKTLADTILYQQLEQKNFIKTNLSSHKFDTINNIFCSRSLDTCLFTTCIPIYRDILIFKNKNKTIGIAKICFHCKKSLIIGVSDRATSLCLKDGYEYFDDYTRLKEVLYSK